MKEPKISDYALIGNSRAAALVSAYGSIDWCCLPEFDSPSIFTALLDRIKGGYFSISPSETYKSAQKYVNDTNVVETCFITAEGEVRLTDAFMVMTEEEKSNSLFPDHEILRAVEGVEGVVKMKMEFAPTLFFGKKLPFLKDKKKLGIHFYWNGDLFALLSTLPEQIIITDDTRAIAEFTVTPGERILFSLSHSSQSPAILTELQNTGWKRMANTIEFWRNWIRKCKYRGLYYEQVKRSALALKLLTHAPSGAIIAAPTSSLPEKIGNDRNWDYRYCWLRDASFTTRVLINLGFYEEVHAYMNWILHATQLTRPELKVVYSVYGHARLKEKILDWLPGYRGSSPVRVGNDADDQFQLDVYGEVLDAIYMYAPFVTKFDRDTTKFIIGLGNVICALWKDPDNGIWEIRSSRAHHTHSKVMCWVGLDRLIKLCEKYHWKDAPLKKFKDTANSLYKEIEQFGYNHELNCYTRELMGNTLDASALTFSLVNYLNPSDIRMVSTTEKIYRQLSKNNMVYRYKEIDDGMTGEEGSFGICNFWLAENLARSGRLEKAIEVFEATLKCASPAGLLSEEIDPESGELIGNYPQGFTHIGLVNAALAIDEQYRKKQVPVPQEPQPLKI